MEAYLKEISEIRERVDQNYGFPPNPVPDIATMREADRDRLLAIVEELQRENAQLKLDAMPDWEAMYNESRAAARSLEERLKLAEKVVEAARDLSEFRSDKSLLRQYEDVVIAVEAYDSARASDNLQKKEDLSSTPTERLWCAAFGVWGSHQSGTCPEIKK